MVTWSALGGATVAVGVALGVLAGAVWLRYDGPGLLALVATLTGHSLYALSYGVNLLVFDTTVSRLLEIPFWFAGELFTVTFLFFALAFTGRGRYLTRRNTVLVSLVPSLTVLLAATNGLGLHQAFWSDYRVVETLGAAVRVFDPAPWLYVKSTYASILVGAGLLMFAEEIFIERTLHRTQSIALVVGSTVPLIGYGAWLLNLGPYPQVDFSPLLLAVTFVTFGYAVFVADLFDTAPAVRRLGRRNTIEDLDEAIAIVTDEGVVTDLNDTASDLFGCRRAAALGKRVDALIDGDTLDFDQSTQVLSLQTAAGIRTFRVTIEPTTDDRAVLIGYTILFYDVTEERRREQRMAVLNRILRHNLRNSLNLIIGAGERIEERTSDETVVEWTGRIVETATELAELGEKAHEFETTIEDGVEREPVALGPIVEDVCEEYRGDYPTAIVDVDVPREAVADADPELVRLIASNLIENALDHHDGETPRVEVRGEVEARDDTIVLRVIDDGPGIPETELATLRTAAEEPLQHSEGIGLWIVTWCVRALGGTVDVASSDDGTTVSVELQAPSPRGATENAAP